MTDIQFIGQSRILKELEYQIPSLQEGENTNYLLKAPTGYGKTTLARIMIYSILSKSNPKSFCYTLPNDDGKVTIDLKKRVIFIDEIHFLKNPETLYPVMDKREHIFIIATNESGTLKDALVRRCIPLIFDDYTIGEMMLIVKGYFNSKGMEINDEVARTISENTNNSPGNAVILGERLSLIFRKTGVLQTREAVESILKGVLAVTNGLTHEHIKYIDFLRRMGPTSINTLVEIMNVDKGTILHIIEPVLIRKGIIRITARGRVLNEIL